ncbi:MAG: hypothetical protein ABJA82_01035 [Myxococcales bacterium]
MIGIETNVNERQRAATIASARAQLREMGASGRHRLKKRSEVP